jgi:hypothetical protein
VIDLQHARESLIEAARRLVDSCHVRSISAVPDAIEVLSVTLDAYRRAEQQLEAAERPSPVAADDRPMRGSRTVDEIAAVLSRPGLRIEFAARALATVIVEEREEAIRRAIEP